MIPARTLLAGVVAVATTLLVAACGGSSGLPAGTNGKAADVTFLQDMIPHHEQAIAAGQVAANIGADPRVTAFGRRIVREQRFFETKSTKECGVCLKSHYMASIG